MRILMVCLGNICRSPLAQGILEAKIENKNIVWEVDSAGTSAYHSGEPPDSRSIEIALKNGIDIRNQRSRQVCAEDLDYFDLILAMDQNNLQNLYKLSEKKLHRDKIKLIMEFVFPGQNRAVPDPYYDNGFDRVHDMLDQAADRIIDHFSARLE